jgi:hypothetical protein
MAGHAENIPRRSVIRLDDLVANDVQHAINPSKSRRIIITLRQQVFRNQRQSASSEGGRVRGVGAYARANPHNP